MMSVSLLFLKLLTLPSGDENKNASGAFPDVEIQNIPGAKVAPTSGEETGSSFVEKLDYADRKLQEICKKYKAFLVDFCGAYLVFCGIGAKIGREEKHVVYAARMAGEILDNDWTKERGLQWQCVLHKGTVHTVLVNNGVPKCYVVGDPIEKAQTLMGHSAPGKALLSQDFYLNLKLCSDHTRFQTVFNAKVKIQVGVSASSVFFSQQTRFPCFWFQEKQFQLYTQKLSLRSGILSFSRRINSFCEKRSTL